MGLKVQLPCKVEDSHQLQGRVVIKIFNILIDIMHWLIMYNSSCTAYNKWNRTAKGKFSDSCVAVKPYISRFSYPVLNMPCIFLVQFSMAELTKEISQHLHMFTRYVDFIQTKKPQTKPKKTPTTTTEKPKPNQNKNPKQYKTKPKQNKQANKQTKNTIHMHSTTKLTKSNIFLFGNNA